MRSLTRFLAIVVVALVTACGGGGGGGGSSPSDDSGGDPGNGNNDSDGSGGGTDNVSGRTVKGVMSDADVVASVRDGSGWTELDTATTDAEGHFALDLGNPDAPVRITVSAASASQMVCDAPSGCGDTAYGNSFTPATGFSLSTLVPASRISEDTELAVTPLTNMAAAWAQDFPQGVNKASVKLAHTRVANLFGLSPDYAYNTPVDITEDSEVDAAADGALQHSIFAASFAELAANESLDPLAVTTDAATMFNLLGGQALNQSGELTRAQVEQWITDLGGDPSVVLDGINVDRVAVSGLDNLVSAAESVGQHINDGGELDSLINDFSSLSTDWNGRLLTALGGSTDFDTADFDRALVPLDDYDHYQDLAATGTSGIDANHRNLGWLYENDTARTDTEGLLTVISEALGHTVDAAICVPELKNGISCSLDNANASIVTDETNTFGNYTEGHVEISGDAHGQTVNLEIRDTASESDLDIRDLLEQGTLPLSITGTINNGTADTSLDLDLTLDITDNDLQPFQELSALDYADSATLDPLLQDLANNLKIDVILTGNGSIASTEEAIDTYTFNNLDTTLHYNNKVVSQDVDAPLMTMTVADGNRTNPAGETLSAAGSGEALNLVLDDPATLSQSYSYDELNLPPMTFTSSGQLSGTAPIITTLGDYFGSYLSGETPAEELDIDWDALMADLDLGLLGLDGNATLDIQDSDDGQKTYEFTLNNGAVEVSKPNSTDTALTLYQRGLTGYIYSGDSLVSTLHIGNSQDGILLSLTDGSQRSYPRPSNGASGQVDNLMLLLESLLDALSSTSGSTST